MPEWKFAQEWKFTVKCHIGENNLTVSNFMSIYTIWSQTKRNIRVFENPRALQKHRVQNSPIKTLYVMEYK